MTPTQRVAMVAALNALEQQDYGQNTEVAKSIRDALAEPDMVLVCHQYQARDKTWHPFLDEKHYINTVTDGSWPIRALYASPQSTPVTVPQYRIKCS